LYHKPGPGQALAAPSNPGHSPPILLVRPAGRHTRIRTRLREPIPLSNQTHIHYADLLNSNWAAVVTMRTDDKPLAWPTLSMKYHSITKPHYTYHRLFFHPNTTPSEKITGIDVSRWGIRVYVGPGSPAAPKLLPRKGLRPSPC